MSITIDTTNRPDLPKKEDPIDNRPKTLTEIFPVLEKGILITGRIGRIVKTSLGNSIVRETSFDWSLGRCVDPVCMIQALYMAGKCIDTGESSSGKSSFENLSLPVHQEKEKPKTTTLGEWIKRLQVAGYYDDSIDQDWQLLEQGRELPRRRSRGSGRRRRRRRGRRQLRKRKSGHVWRSKYTGPKLTLISGVYRAGPQHAKGQVQLKMEHCATSSSEMIRNPKVKCRKKIPENKKRGSNKPWVNISDVFPDAKVELKRNYVELIINAPMDCYEFAVFGTPLKNDRKRMQMGVFGEKPVQGRDWKIWVTLFDDTRMAFQHVCDMEEGRGHRLLTTLAGLFVSNSDEDIKIDLSPLESGWEIMGSNTKTIKSKDAWNSPENSTDFPRCHFEISHVDETKQSFFCGITASHGNDTAETDVIEFYEEENEQNSGLDTELGNFTGEENTVNAKSRLQLQK